MAAVYGITLAYPGKNLGELRTKNEKGNFVCPDSLHETMLYQSRGYQFGSEGGLVRTCFFHWNLLVYVIGHRMRLDLRPSLSRMSRSKHWWHLGKLFP